MRVLVTGGAGYIGSAAVEQLIAKGESVVVLGCVDDEPTATLPGLELLGKLGDVPGLVERLAVDDVIVALPASNRTR